MNAVAVNPTATSPGIGVLVCQARNEIVACFEGELARSGFGVNFTQYLALKRLAVMGPMTATDLAKEIRHDAGAMTRVLDRLQKKGYLTREPHPHDRRARQISLTEAGKAAWNAMRLCGEKAQERAQRDISSSEQAELADLLNRILARLRESA